MSRIRKGIFVFHPHSSWYLVIWLRWQCYYVCCLSLCNKDGINNTKLVSETTPKESFKTLSSSILLYISSLPQNNKIYYGWVYKRIFSYLFHQLREKRKNRVERPPPNWFLKLFVKYNQEYIVLLFLLTMLQKFFACLRSVFSSLLRHQDLLYLPNISW